jgi:acetoin utilization protein AcuB
MNEIKNFMTRSPHAIGHDQSLKLAHERMHHFGIRHLPVLDGGVLVGVLSERDIALIGAISPHQVETTTVEEAMSTEPYAVEPNTDAEVVTAHMAEHKHGCAVVMDGHKVAGVFTTTDALSLLTVLLRESKSDGAAQRALTHYAGSLANGK